MLKKILLNLRKQNLRYFISKNPKNEFISEENQERFYENLKFVDNVLDSEKELIQEIKEKSIKYEFYQFFLMEKDQKILPKILYKYGEKNKFINLSDEKKMDFLLQFFQAKEKGLIESQQSQKNEENNQNINQLKILSNIEDVEKLKEWEFEDYFQLLSSIYSQNQKFKFSKKNQPQLFQLFLLKITNPSKSNWFEELIYLNLLIKFFNLNNEENIQIVKQNIQNYFDIIFKNNEQILKENQSFVVFLEYFENFVWAFQFNFIDQQKLNKLFNEFLEKVEIEIIQEEQIQRFLQILGNIIDSIIVSQKLRKKMQIILRNKNHSLILYMKNPNLVKIFFTIIKKMNINIFPASFDPFQIDFILYFLKQKNMIATFEGLKFSIENNFFIRKQNIRMMKEFLQLLQEKKLNVSNLEFCLELLWFFLMHLKKEDFVLSNMLFLIENLIFQFDKKFVKIYLKISEYLIKLFLKPQRIYLTSLHFDIKNSQDNNNEIILLKYLLKDFYQNFFKINFNEITSKDQIQFIEQYLDYCKFTNQKFDNGFFEEKQILSLLEKSTNIKEILILGKILSQMQNSQYFKIFDILNLNFFTFEEKLKLIELYLENSFQNQFVTKNIKECLENLLKENFQKQTSSIINQEQIQKPNLFLKNIIYEQSKILSFVQQLNILLNNDLKQYYSQNLQKVDGDDVIHTLYYLIINGYSKKLIQKISQKILQFFVFSIKIENNFKYFIIKKKQNLIYFDLIEKLSSINYYTTDISEKMGLIFYWISITQNTQNYKKDLINLFSIIDKVHLVGLEFFYEIILNKFSSVDFTLIDLLKLPIYLSQKFQISEKIDEELKNDPQFNLIKSIFEYSLKEKYFHSNLLNFIFQNLSQFTIENKEFLNDLFLLEIPLNDKKQLINIFLNNHQKIKDEVKIFFIYQFFVQLLYSEHNNSLFDYATDLENIAFELVVKNDYFKFDTYSKEFSCLFDRVYTENFPMQKQTFDFKQLSLTFQSNLFIEEQNILIQIPIYSFSQIPNFNTKQLMRSFFWLKYKERIIQKFQLKQDQLVIEENILKHQIFIERFSKLFNMYFTLAIPRVNIKKNHWAFDFSDEKFFHVINLNEFIRGKENHLTANLQFLTKHFSKELLNFKILTLKEIEQISLEKFHEFKLQKEKVEDDLDYIIEEENVETIDTTEQIKQNQTKKIQKQDKQIQNYFQLKQLLSVNNKFNKMNGQNSKSQITIEGKKVGNYLLGKVLGKGQFGKVWKAKQINTNSEYAVKKIEKSKIESNSILQRLLKTEVSIMHEINHPNILHLYDFLESKNNYYLVIDFCNQGDFENYLKINGVKFLEEKKAVYFLKQIMNGFQALRKHKVLHRDFKLANLFVNDETLVIGDFGFAKSGQEMAETKLGTPLTMAYEILTATSENSVYNSKADLWSVGVVYYQMLFGKTPFFGFTMQELIQDIKKKINNLEYPQPISEESKDIIHRLLKTNPKERIDWHDFFNHPLFRKYSSETKLDDLNEIYQTIGDQLINPRQSKFEDEFRKNQNEAKETNEINFMNQDNLLKYGDQKNMEVNQIEEQSLDQQTQLNLEKDLAFQEISFRYNHEKNKILFLIYTVKKIQKFLKKGFFQPVKEELFKISILLMKKAITLNLCNEQHLDQGNNVYFLNLQFFTQIKKSPIYNNIKNIFKGDKIKMEKYLQLIIQRSQKNGFVNAFQTILEQSNPSLSEIDQKIQSLYVELQKYTNSTELHLQEKKRPYFLILYSIKLSINCEKIFIYLQNNEKELKKFNWTQFFTNHEDLNILRLTGLLQS